MSYIRFYVRELTKSNRIQGTRSIFHTLERTLGHTLQKEDITHHVPQDVPLDVHLQNLYCLCTSSASSFNINVTINIPIGIPTGTTYLCISLRLVLCFLLHVLCIETISFSRGDFVVFPNGLKCPWIVSRAVQKHYRFI